ncbi:hypothetical protein HNQ92_005438 [Rhabdobacter roseus]|uniref:Uncharacterized protein n=1 Tax=Rhabdobacter roseus TaxID=1655419 RepID=A0A840TWH0_9BACT|nr:hypothetical protein [Rhabdobacter roseus]MBB5287275.1 hypothetical protein [Rhabdobacter roseus]
MNRNVLIASIVALLAFGMGWFFHDLKSATFGSTPGEPVPDNVRVPGAEPESSESAADAPSGYAGKISGRFILKGSQCAGFDFINPTSAAWTNEVACQYPDTLKLRWLGNRTFFTQDSKRTNEASPPRVWIYEVISFDGQTLVLNSPWTGWNDFKDERLELVKASD